MSDRESGDGGSEGPDRKSCDDSILSQSSITVLKSSIDDRLREPDVTLTDFALAVECAVLAGLTASRPDSTLHFWFIVFFAATGTASLLGGIFHGFFTLNSWTGSWLWVLTLLAIGVAAGSGWFIGSELLFADRRPAWIPMLAAVQFGAYALVVLTANRTFGIAVANYLPPTLFLLAAYAIAHHANPSRPHAMGLAGLVVMVIAAIGQQLRLGLHRTYFTHNAVFHVGQGVALYLLYLAGGR